MIAVFIRTKAIQTANHVNVVWKQTRGGDDRFGGEQRVGEREEHHWTHRRAQWSSAGGKHYLIETE